MAKYWSSQPIRMLPERQSSGLVSVLRTSKLWLTAPLRAKYEMVRDRLPLGEDPGLVPVLTAANEWMLRAQENSASNDGGVARDYSLRRGWATSYPETTGYIIPTILEESQWSGDTRYRMAARRMLDWLLRIQMSNGAFQGGRIDSEPVTPVVFNTGQILMGLAAGQAVFGGACTQATQAAADWLVDVQDADGCWRQGASPFARAGDKAYDAHVAWGLIEAFRVTAEARYLNAAVQNIRWVMTQQSRSGWIAQCCLSDPRRPLTHTIGYALRGLVETYCATGDPAIRTAAERLGEGLLGVQAADGSIPGRLTEDWEPAVGWSCLTGSVQIAACWLRLDEASGSGKFTDAALRANSYVRRTVKLASSDGTRGGVKGSHPIDGGYGRFEYLNWAAKFLVDALVLEGNARGTWSRSPVTFASDSRDCSQ